MLGALKLHIQLQPSSLLLLLSVKCNYVYTGTSLITIFLPLSQTKTDLQHRDTGNYSPPLTNSGE